MSSSISVCCSSFISPKSIIIGLIQSYRTPFWNDEVYTQKNLKQYSYMQIIEGKLPEGCNEPLFYLIQIMKVN